jgi:hypothetical protein
MVEDIPKFRLFSRRYSAQEDHIEFHARVERMGELIDLLLDKLDEIGHPIPEASEGRTDASS